MLLFRKELLGKISLFFISIIITLLISELIFRIFYPVKFYSFFDHSTKNWARTEDVFHRSVVRPSRTLGYELKPNSEFFRTNSFGMMDKERTKDKPKGVYRIICLGDSTTANSDYARILEVLLNEGKKEKFEVWNCGVLGYGAIQYFRGLKEKWLKYDSDMVIIGFCLNDFTTTPLLIREGEHFVGYFPNKEILPKVNPFLLKNSALYRFIVMRVFFSKKDYYDDTVKQIRSYLQEAKELLSARKIPFLIVVFGFAE